MSLTVSKNEIIRQSTPMLKTNGSAASRTLYDGDKVSSLIVIPSCTNLGGTIFIPPLMGVMLVSIRTRFAGMINPAISVPRPMLAIDSASTSSIVNKSG